MSLLSLSLAPSLIKLAHPFLGLQHQMVSHYLPKALQTSTDVDSGECTQAMQYVQLIQAAQGTKAHLVEGICACNKSCKMSALSSEAESKPLTSSPWNKRILTSFFFPVWATESAIFVSFQNFLSREYIYSLTKHSPGPIYKRVF